MKDNQDARVWGVVLDIRDEKTILGFMVMCKCDLSTYWPVGKKFKHKCPKCGIELDVFIENQGKKVEDFKVAYQ